MKKQKTILCCLLLFLWAGCSQSPNNSSDVTSGLQPESTSEAGRDLRELLLKVEAQLPEEWAVTLSPDKDQLVIVLEKKAPVEYRSEGAVSLLKRVDEQIQIVLVQLPFLTADDYKERKDSNHLAKQKRIDFEEKHLSHLFDHVLQNHKISKHPFPPEMYDPQTAEDKQAVNDYTDLWQNTEPVELPTHRFKSASFQINHYPITNVGGSHIYIGDTKVSEQHDDILASLDGLLTKYE